MTKTKNKNKNIKLGNSNCNSFNPFGLPSPTLRINACVAVLNFYFLLKLVCEQHLLRKKNTDAKKNIYYFPQSTSKFLLRLVKK